MTLQDALYVLRSRWKTLVVVTVAATVLAIAWAALATPKYMGSTRIFLATSGAPDGQDAYALGRLAQGRAVAYKDLIMTESLATRTVRRLKLNDAPRDLVKKIGASANADSVVITLSVIDSSGSNAVSLANALSEDFVSMVRDLETPAAGTPAAGTPPILRAVVVQPAVDPMFVSPNRPKIILFGVFAGLLLGTSVVLLRGRAEKRNQGGPETNSKITSTNGTASNGSRSPFDVSGALRW